MTGCTSTITTYLCENLVVRSPDEKVASVQTVLEISRKLLSVSFLDGEL